MLQTPKNNKNKLSARPLFINSANKFSVLYAVQFNCTVKVLKFRRTLLWRLIFRRLFEYFGIRSKFLISYFWNISYQDIEQAPIVIISEWGENYDFCRYVRSYFPDKRLVIWIWNLHTQLDYNLYKQSGWEVWSFDKNECEKYGLNYSKTFIAAAYVPLVAEKPAIKYDIFFFGRDKGRKDKIQRIKSFFDNLHIINRIEVYDSLENVTTYDQILRQTQKANSILDVSLDRQEGITQREMEALFFGKKLITTNSVVKTRDYYHPNNIFVIEGDEDFEKIAEFLQKPFVPIDEKIVEPYSIPAWIERFLENKNAKNYDEIERKSLLTPIKQFLIWKIFPHFTPFLFRTIRTYFNADDQRFKKILRKAGFHNTIVENPEIIFDKQNNNLHTKIPYFSPYAKLVIKMFVCSSKNNILSTKSLNIREQYCYNHELFLENYHNKFQRIELPAMQIKTRRIAIYTVDIGGYDKIFDPLVVSENCDYLLFTDNPNVKTKTWQVIPVDKSNFSNDLLCSRYYKILPHKILREKYDYSIYLDSKMLICGDIVQLCHRGLTPQSFEKTGDSHISMNDVVFTAIRHNARRTIIEEAGQCIRRGVIPVDVAEKQLADYHSQGFPDDLGLIDCCCLVRRHSDRRLQQTMETWFAEFEKYPYRDQLSIMYSLWKTNLKNYKIIESNVYNNQFVQYMRKNCLYK
jgi:hypothetical protein